MDRNAESLGPYICDAFVAKPPCDEASDEYFHFWQHLLATEAAQLVLPGLEPDLFFLNENRHRLSAAGFKPALNSPALIELARDKSRMAEELAKLNIPTIPTVLSGDWDECIEALGRPPLLMKPRRGSGSRGIVVVHGKDDFEYWRRKYDDGYLVQRIVGSDAEEYTVGSFGLGTGESIRPIIFRRRLSVGGSTQYAEVVEDREIATLVEVLSAHFKPVGPTNYQFRKEGEIPYLLEINPRLSSSTSIRSALGYNEAEMCVDFYLYGKKPDAPSIASGRAWRYSEDFIINDSRSI